MDALNVEDSTYDKNLKQIAKEKAEKIEEKDINKMTPVNLMESQDETKTKQDVKHYNNEKDYQRGNPDKEGTMNDCDKLNEESMTYDVELENYDENTETCLKIHESSDGKNIDNVRITNSLDDLKTTGGILCKGAQVQLSQNKSDLFRDLDDVPPNVIEQPQDAVALPSNKDELLQDMVEQKTSVKLSQNTTDLSEITHQYAKDIDLQSDSFQMNVTIASENQHKKDTCFIECQNIDTHVPVKCYKTSSPSFNDPISIKDIQNTDELRCKNRDDGDVPIPESFVENSGENSLTTNEIIQDPGNQELKEGTDVIELVSESLDAMTRLTTPITIDTIREVSQSLKDEDDDTFYSDHVVENKTKKHTRIALIGITGCGKSATGNSLLGEKFFKTSAGSTSITSKCEHGRRCFKDRIIEVVDTPGLYDTDRSEEDVQRELARCICMLAPGPHAFLIVIRVGRFNEQEQKTVDSLVNFFGEDGFLRYSIVIITRTDELEFEEITFEKFINDSPPSFKEIITQCGGRCFAMNNRLKGKDEIDTQTERLLLLIDEMVNASGGECYTHTLFEEVEKERQKKIEEEKKRKEEEQRLKSEKEKEMEMKLKEKEKEIQIEREKREQLKREMKRKEKERKQERRLEERERELEEKETKFRIFRMNKQMELERAQERMERESRNRQRDRERDIYERGTGIARKNIEKSYCIIS
ncbi:hypothetical protein KUTeg_013704 [Tegillarca granosa]|uniref:AIG1-type G domain-containing protein n=1 Tax=Tegillarca granosa TaxID=220873 RepID=A0ABQ9EYB6_TEGGR|nr:hypothetical protein KUTeg_013704 [Tegillarca granosa]